MTPLRVLHVIPSVASSDGGPSRAIALMERSLVDAGAKVTTLTTDHELIEAQCGAPANGANRIYARKWFSTYKIAPGLVCFLWEHIREFDVVHVHALFSFAPTAAAWIARLKGVPYIVRPLGTLTGYGMQQRRRWLKSIFLRFNEGPILRHAAAVHFTSLAEMQEAQALGLKMRGVIIPLGVEATFADDLDLRREYPSLAGRKIVLFLSRLDPKKNLEVLIEAFAGSADLQREAVLLIAGGGSVSYLEALKAHAANCGVGDSIVWLGHVEGEKKAAAFRSADLFALPSYSENFGIAAAEAMLFGLPCVLSPGVAIAEEAAKAGAAVIAEPNGAAIAKQLTELLNNRERRLVMTKIAHDFAEVNYSTATMTKRLCELYRNLMSEERKHCD